MIACRLAAFAVVLAFVAVPQARGDSWMPPGKATYLSPDQRTRLTVLPRGLENRLADLEGEDTKKEGAGQAAEETPATARAVLERRGQKGGWTRIWEAPLVNEVAPTRALVANGGQHVFTFDNWYSLGFGPDAVVIYGADGGHVRSFALTDLLPETYIRALPRSVSSLWWGGEHRLSPDGRQLILAIAMPGEDSPHSGETVAIAIDLASARLVPPSGPAWDRALARAGEVTRARDADEAARRAAFIAPLLGPSPATERGWHAYLEEAFSRLEPDLRRDPDLEEVLLSAQVLRSPDAADYKPSETWLRGALKDAKRDGDAVAIASLAPPEHLVRVLAEAVRGVKAGSLARAWIFVAVPAAWRDRAVAALAPTGARIIHLDPAVPIPQHAERLKKQTEADAFENSADQLEADVAPHL